MIKTRVLDTIMIFLLIMAILFSVLLLNGNITLQNQRRQMPYQDKLFNQDFVHQINLQIEDKEAFFENALQEEYVPSDITIDGETISNVGLRTKGNNSLRLTEKYGHQRFSMKIEFDHYENQLFHGLDKFSLDSSFQDNSYMKTFLAMDMMQFMGVKAPLFSYAWVTINDEPWGLFLAIEEIEDSFARRNYGMNHGQLYKASYASLEDHNSDIKLIYTDDKFESYDNLFRNAKFKPQKEDKERLISAIKGLSERRDFEQYIDVDAVLRYFVVQVFVVNLDSYLGHTSHNYFLYEENGKISMLPWDYNLAFATYSLGMPYPVNDSNLYINYPIDTPNKGEIMLERPLYHYLMQEGEYYHAYHDLFDDFISEYFETEMYLAKINQIDTMIHSYVKKDPTAFISYEDYKTGVATMKDFLKLRSESIRGQLNGEIPKSFAEQEENPSSYIDASHLKLEDLGEIDELKD